MTRKQVDDVEKDVAEALVKYERNKDQLERINKVLVNAKAGIEHLCEKLNDLKAAGMPNVIVTDNTLVEALIKCEEKLDQLYGQIKNDIMYDEAMLKIRGGRPQTQEGVPENMGARLMTSSIGFAGGATTDPSAYNIRVKLPDKDDDDLSEVDNEAEKEAEANERMKIKLEA